MKVGVVQMLVGKDKTANINRATKLVTEASQNGAKLVILPVSVHLFVLLIYTGMLQFPLWDELLPGLL